MSNDNKPPLGAKQTGQFMTIAGRWRKHEEILKHLPKRERALAMMMFYAGFSASLEAGLELAEIDDDAECVRLLQCMHEEVKMVEAMAVRVMAEIVPS